MVLDGRCCQRRSLSVATQDTNWQKAKGDEKDKLASIAEGKLGSQGKVARQTFNAATDAGARLIPLNRDAVLAMSELLQRCEMLGATSPDHYVFPACENGNIQPDKPMVSWRSAWRSLTKAAGLKGLRFHDLRHQAITELLEKGLSDQAIMEVAGHVSREMLAHYSHMRLKAKRDALSLLETPLPEVSQVSDSAGSQTVN